MRQTKARYLEFCQSAYVPLQLQAWWLDAVCGPESWNLALATDAGDRVTGVLPWFFKRRFGLRVIQLPPFSTYAGPWLHYPEEPGFKLQSRYTFEKKVYSQLIAQLPDVAFFLQNFRPEVENWLPFYWENFIQTTRYTYIFDSPANFEQITAGMKNTLRSDLKKAAQMAEWQRDDAAWTTVFQLNALSFQRKNMAQPYERTVFERLHQALHQRGQMACFIASDRASESPCAGLYLAYDARQASVLLSGTHPDFKASCAVYALFVEAIKFCGEKGLSLDFEGSMQPDIEHTFRAFGARQQPYFQVWKAKNRILDLLFHLKNQTKH